MRQITLRFQILYKLVVYPHEGSTSMKYPTIVLSIVILMALIPLSLGSTSESTVTTIEITPSAQQIECNSTFSVHITVNPTEPFAGVQCSLTYDPNLLSCTSVSRGNLFQGSNTYFHGGTLDAKNGTISYVIGLAITGNINTSGTLASINFTAKHQGTSPLNLTHVIMGNRNARPLPVMVIHGQVTVGTPSQVDTHLDVNEDGIINILDLVLIGQHWGETGPPCWIPTDVTCDGIINILDMIAVAQQWN